MLMVSVFLYRCRQSHLGALHPECNGVFRPSRPRPSFWGVLEHGRFPVAVRWVVDFAKYTVLFLLIFGSYDSVLLNNSHVVIVKDALPLASFPLRLGAIVVTV